MACELYKKRRRSCRQCRKSGEEDLTMSKFESVLESSLDPIWIQIEETIVVDEMLMVANFDPLFILEHRTLLQEIATVNQRS